MVDALAVKAMKDVEPAISFGEPANMLRSEDFRMGKPTLRRYLN